jgi:DNA repair protein RecO (recombination protein O)
MLISDNAICIRTVDYSETSQVVTFFTERTGKLTAIAKGSKRAKSAFGGPLELVACGRIGLIETHGDKLATLTDFEQTTAHKNLVADLYRYNCCLFAAELVNLLTDDYDPHPGLYESLVTLLKSVNEAPKGCPRSIILASLITFQFSMLREVGLAPVMTTCVNCKRKFDGEWRQAWFSNAASGLVCRDCEMSFPDKTLITRKTVASLDSAAALDKMSLQALTEIEKLLIEYVSYSLGKAPKMARHILGK